MPHAVSQFVQILRQVGPGPTRCVTDETGTERTVRPPARGQAAIPSPPVVMQPIAPDGPPVLDVPAVGGRQRTGSRDPCCAGAAFGDGPADTARLAPPPSAARPSRKRRRFVRFACESSDVDTGIRRMFAPELSRREDHNHPPLFLTFHTRGGRGDGTVWRSSGCDSSPGIVRPRLSSSGTVYHDGGPAKSTQGRCAACVRTGWGDSLAPRILFHDEQLRTSWPSRRRTGFRPRRQGGDLGRADGHSGTGFALNSWLHFDATTACQGSWGRPATQGRAGQER